MKFAVFSLGCKVNQYEGQAMAEKLAERGHTAVTDLQPADAYIFNTCSVTAEADKKSRQLIAKANRLNPDAPIYICGCSSQYAAEQYGAKKNVRLVIGTTGKTAFVDSILSDIESTTHSPIVHIAELPKAYEETNVPKATRTRWYIKVQDGCNNFCTYCIIPYLRGRSRSRSIESILTEAKKAAAVSSEIVLTGVDISAYGRDIGTDLPSLVAALQDIPARKRISSLECGVISEGLLTAMQTAGFCDHFHLSLQSGCDTVLRRMNRHYTMQTFAEKVDMIRRFFPLAGITTDIITGFPEETELEHEQSYQAVENLAFSDIHVFPYSRRRGTVASAMSQVPQEIRIRRAHRFGALKERLRNDFFDRNFDTEHSVYFETVSPDGWAEGYTENYIKVYSPNVAANTVASVRIKEKFQQGVKGELV